MLSGDGQGELLAVPTRGKQGSSLIALVSPERFVCDEIPIRDQEECLDRRSYFSSAFKGSEAVRKMKHDL